MNKLISMDKNSKIFNRSISDKRISSTYNDNLLMERDFAKDLPDPTRFFKNKSGKPDFSDIKGKCAGGKCELKKKKDTKPRDETNEISKMTFDNAHKLSINENLLNDRNFGLSKDHQVNNNMFTNNVNSLEKQIKGTHQSEITFANNTLSLKSLVYFQHYFPSFFYSGYSLLSCISMYYIGTFDETEKEITEALSLKSKNSAYNSLANLNTILAKSDSVNVANCVFLNNRFDVKPKYKEFILRLGIFDKINVLNPMEACERINGFVAANTKNMITQIVTAGMINPSICMVLVNAIHFKSDWKISFDKKSTKDEPFYSVKGDSLCKMMNLEKDLLYYESKEHQLLELEYQDNQFVFGMWLPKKTEKVVIIPSTKDLLSDINHLYKTRVNLKMPRFTKEMEYNIVPFFNFLGIKICFSDSAQTYGISENYPLPISAIIHKAKIEVNEKGAEAAAATMVKECMMIGYDADPKNFYANRPFVYYVRHIETNSILFMGKYDL